MDRRHFLVATGTLASASAAGLIGAGAEPKRATTAATLPMIRLGSHQVTRLIVGSNPINGNSYQGPHADRHMREYFTVDQAAEFLRACERAGINTHQFSTSNLEKSAATLRKLREGGSSLQFICLARKRPEIREATEKTRPIAVVHHGGVTDRLFQEGKSGEVRDFVKAVHDQGLLAGVSTHNPEVIGRIADEGWEVNFFMACFYYLTRNAVPKPEASPSETLQLTYTFYRNDPQVMTRVIREVKQPCLAFKILAAGRLCLDQEQVRGAFHFAYANIKPTDGVIIGMYPRFFDEIAANVRYARDFSGASS